MKITTATEDPPPPPPRRVRHGEPNTEPVRVRGLLPLYQRRKLTIGLGPGFLITVTGIWMTRGRWERSAPALLDSGWHPWEFGFIVVAIRVEY
jgi:hypothetical protein